MYHPIIGNKVGQITFAAWWIALSAIHFAVFAFIYKIPYAQAATDSVISNALYAFVSLGLWYWVRLSDIETTKPASLLINRLGASALSLTFIVFVQHYTLGFIFAEDEKYITFLNDSMVSRSITGALIYILVVLVFYLIIYIQNFREKVSRESELKALVKDAELNWLKLQLNPHFLFNSLNSVSSLTISSPERAQEMIIRLSELLRYSLKQSPDSMVTLQNELDNCVKYLEIEKVRFGARLSYTINTTPECLTVKVPGMIMQPLFENAIKHSVAQSADESIIEAVISKNDEFVEITITNSIPQDSFPSGGTGVGLENIRRRLKLIYGTSQFLNIEKTESQFTASIQIPINETV